MGEPAVPSDKVVTTYKIDKQLYEAYRQGISGTPEKIQVLGKIAAEQGKLGQVKAEQSGQTNSTSQIPAIIPPVVVKQEFPDSAQGSSCACFTAVPSVSRCYNSVSTYA